MFARAKTDNQPNTTKEGKLSLVSKYPEKMFVKGPISPLKGFDKSVNKYCFKLILRKFFLICQKYSRNAQNQGKGTNRVKKITITNWLLIKIQEKSNSNIKTSLLRRLQAQTLPDEAPPKGKIHPFSKMAVTFEPLMGF